MNEPRDEFTESKEFYRTYLGLSCIPSDIPADAISVSLYGNQIDYLKPNNFIHLNLCLALDLSFNSIRSLQDQNTFCGLWSLVKLHLEANNIHQIEDGAFTELSSLQVLGLTFNELSEIRKMQLTGLAQLEYLLLDLNKIVSIENGAFGNLAKLQYLSLTGNMLTQLSGMFLGVKLNYLNLARNNITTINQYDLSTLPRPLRLGLYGNPWQCDNRLCWLKQEGQAGTIELLNSWGSELDCQTGDDWKKLQCTDCYMCKFCKFLLDQGPFGGAIGTLCFGLRMCMFDFF